MSYDTGTADHQYGEVADWATDFDHSDPAYNRDAHTIWRDLTTGGCPVAHSSRYGGMWVPLTHQLVSEIAYDSDRFSSRSVVVSRIDKDLIPDAPVGAAPPITSDPPFHHGARRILLPPFAPKRIGAWEPEVRDLCGALLDEALERGDGRIDAAVEYAQHVPVGVTSRMLGLPTDDEKLFRVFVHELLEGARLTPNERQAATGRIEAYLAEQVERHRRQPGDDMISYLLDAEIPGPDGVLQPLSDRHIVGTIQLLLLAGIDTTWSAIGSSLWHLATHPHDRMRLVADTDLIPTAVEEFLRAYAPVTMARLVAEDHDFHGHAMKRDDWVLLPFPAANRDPAAFDRADEVLIDRAENRHAAFGLGIHRCLGSNLARLELRIAIEEFLARIPDFELSADEVVWSVGQIRGPRRLPLRIRTVSPISGGAPR